MDTFRYLLDQDGINVDLQDRDGTTALMDAATWVHLDMVNILLEEHDADTSLSTKKEILLQCSQKISA